MNVPPDKLILPLVKMAKVTFGTFIFQITAGKIFGSNLKIIITIREIFLPLKTHYDGYSPAVFAVVFEQFF